MNSYKNSTDQPLAGDGGITEVPHREGDPFQALDELMAVVEALCPRWPEREIFRGGDRMLL
jgi:hypothetical protein